MRNVAMRIEYDGTDFVGSQWQTNGRSVQAALEEAWYGLTREQRRVQLAGRTDSGVHARGQVANVQTEISYDHATIVRGMNALLPDDVAVLQSWAVPIDFHARHSAVRREYRYLIDNGRAAAPLLRRHAIYVERLLNVDTMHAALQGLIGTRDFVAFSDGPQEGSTVRSVFAAACMRTEVWGQPIVVVDIAANAFLRHMVRKIVGQLLVIGEGRMQPEALEQTLQGGGRRPQLAPAHGLYLMNVVYPDAVASVS